MENTDFENNIRRAFQQYPVDLDHDEIWDNIEPRLKRKKRRGLLLWWLGGLALAGLLLFWLSPNNSTSVTTELQTEHTLNQAAPLIDQSSNQSTSISEKDQQVPSNYPTAPSSALQDNDLAEKSIEIRKNNNIHISSFPKVLPLTASLDEQALPHQTNTTPLEQQEKRNNSFTGIKINLASLLIELDHPDQWIVAEDLLADFAPRTKNARKKKRKRIRPVRKKGWQTWLRVDAAPIFPIKNLRGNYFSESTYANKRKETETRLEAFGANLGLHFQSRRGALLIVGLEYQQLNERFDQYSFDEVSEIRPGVVTVTENAQGEIINSTTGPKLVTTTTEVRKRYYNQHRFLHIPIGLGLARDRQRYGYKLAGGATYSLHYSFTGHMLSTDLVPIKINKSKNPSLYNNYFKSNAGWGLWLSGEYNRSINSRLQWLVAPKIWIPLSNITPDEFTLKQNYFQVSLHFGINYMLNPQPKKKGRKKAG